MSPAATIAALDRALRTRGQDVTLQSLSAGVVTQQVTCRAFVRSYAPAALVGGVIQGDSQVILSPSEIAAAGWPGAATGPGDDRVPKKGDRLVISGLVRTIEAASPVYLADVLVRIELRVRG